MSSTTTSNFSSRVSGAGFGDLPHHFLQAFRIAARFGIQYVWIDSLCIIQDAAEDWEAESTMMGGYYQLAAFTVISTFPTPDSYADYLPPKPRSLARLPYLDHTGGRKGFFYVYPQRPASDLSNKFTEHMRRSQILTRGWVFQEWLLSRRILCFTPSGVYTQCMCPNDTVRNQLGEDIGLDSVSNTDTAAYLPVKYSLRLQFYSAEDIYCSWESVVEQYSRLAFSYPEKDRMVALLGIAREFTARLAQTRYHQTTDDFVVGLWKGELERGLLWEQVPPRVHQRLSNFPTWSWASVYSAVRWEGRHLINHTGSNISDTSMQIWRRSWVKKEFTSVVCTTPQSHRIRAIDRPLDQQIGSLPEGLLDPCRDRIMAGLNTYVLHLRGRLQAVHIGDYRRPGEVPNLVTPEMIIDGSGQEGQSFSARRNVNIAGLRDVIISGWASVEHPEFQDDSAFSGSPMIFALLVSSTTPRFFSGASIEFNVLYLRRSEKSILDGFERVGMGKLFGDKAADGFRLAMMRDVSLL